MENLFIEPTSKTPLVDFKSNGQLKISGNSYPENVIEFYEPLLKWIDEVLKSKVISISISLELKYINTNFIKFILTLIKKINNNTKVSINVTWLYEIDDEDIYDTGRDIEELTNIKFEFLEKDFVEPVKIFV
ncbi:MAG: DUF1987 domain-containing protein [Sphingobacteriaceae bacterium]|jgi:hypothetical protein